MLELLAECKVAQTGQRTAGGLCVGQIPLDEARLIVMEQAGLESEHFNDLHI
jgi:hypothetical protein